LGTIRTGARSFLNAVQDACRFSRIPGFSNGLKAILGAEVYSDFLGVWTPLCEFVDSLIALDNWYNQKDPVDDDGQGEDEAGLG
jgi:hypothetical protein